MGDLQAGNWVLGILIYFTVYYLFVWSVFGTAVEISVDDPNARNNLDPGFSAIDSYMNASGYCGGDGRYMDWFERITCSYPEEWRNNVTCNSIEGCSYVQVLTQTECYGWVDKTFYGIDDRFGGSYCETSPGFINNRSACEFFGCDWFESSPSSQMSGGTSTNEGVNQYKRFQAQYNAIKFMFGFQTNFEFAWLGWVFVLFFTYIPLLMLAYAILFSIPLY